GIRSGTGSARSHSRAALSEEARKRTSRPPTRPIICVGDRLPKWQAPPVGQDFNPFGAATGLESCPTKRETSQDGPMAHPAAIALRRLAALGRPPTGPCPAGELARVRSRF